MLDLLKKKNNEEEKFIDTLCDLMVNCGFSYSELCGETIKVKSDKFGEMTIERPGMPAPAILAIIRFLNNQRKEESRRIRNIPHKR